MRQHEGTHNSTKSVTPSSNLWGYWPSEATLCPPEVLLYGVELPLQLLAHVHLLLQLPLQLLLRTFQSVNFLFCLLYLSLHCFQAQAQLQRERQDWLGLLLA